MTKTISLSDDAYETLSNVKRRGESFSDLARRLAKTAALDELLDPDRDPVWTRAEADAMLENTYEARDASRTRRYP